ncbi:MAG: 50S ribosomal protein L4 [Candidatus Abyssobacteria bacterium SURF_5]|uniref:Large ribosomal subunit protein uL4 n=1 Tax=Abyssobacteria bacterium (strain SURF_5) TaxID=2093360 RepID=A0A3A4NGZ6_ABYX5|nr:MAG: 50S ribosomal protein L4 [Candidatus Abyssubacteria bacterium SURF_5]
MAESVLYATNGSQLGTIELSDDIFGQRPNEAVVHQVVVAQQAGLRQGTADTKERGEVAGSTKKLWRQKGTGRARVGSGKSPHWRGGGTAFGPHPRDYSQALPKKMRRGALVSLLADRLQEGRLFVLNELKLDTPKTKELLTILRRLNIMKSCLIVTEAPDKNVRLSARNIPGVDQAYVDSLSALDVICHENLVLTRTALELLEKKLS